MTTVATHSSSDHQNLLNGRIELWGYYDYNRCTRVSYYAHEVPSEIKLYKVLIVLGCIFSTPINLLCCIPAIRSLKKTQDILERGDIPAAREAYRPSVWCRILAILWFALFTSIVGIGIVVGIILAVLMNQ